LAHQVVKFQDQRIKPVPIVHAVSNLVRFHSLVRSVGLQGYLSLTATNGCGKSTFMKILTGELTPTSGTVGISDVARKATHVLSSVTFIIDKIQILNLNIKYLANLKL
jgi:ABC-type uncharacterized transport system ATPase subunit